MFKEKETVGKNGGGGAVLVSSFFFQLVTFRTMFLFNRIGEARCIFKEFISSAGYPLIDDARKCLRWAMEFLFHLLEG